MKGTMSLIIVAIIVAIVVAISPRIRATVTETIEPMIQLISPGCTPDEKKCESETVGLVCHPTGREWVKFLCTGNSYCQDGVCINPDMPTIPEQTNTIMLGESFTFTDTITNPSTVSGTGTIFISIGTMDSSIAFNGKVYTTACFESMINTNCLIKPEKWELIQVGSNYYTRCYYAEEFRNECEFSIGILSSGESKDITLQVTPTSAGKYKILITQKVFVKEDTTWKIIPSAKEIELTVL